jgi:hypothetical protein
VDDLAPGEAHDAVAGGLQGSVAGPVALERLAGGVVGVAVDLDDQPLVGPEQVDLIALHADVGVRARQSRGLDHGEQPALGF